MKRPLRRVRAVRILALGALAALILAACTPAGQAAGLAGTEWALTRLNGQAPLPGAALDLAFQADGKVAGSGGCNQSGGDYQTDGDKLSITNLASTMRACADPALNEQEAAYFAALAAVEQFKLDGDHLSLLDAQGSAILEFARQ